MAAGGGRIDQRPRIASAMTAQRFKGRSSAVVGYIVPVSRAATKTAMWQMASLEPEVSILPKSRVKLVSVDRRMNRDLQSRLGHEGTVTKVYGPDLVEVNFDPGGQGCRWGVNPARLQILPASPSS